MNYPAGLHVKATKVEIYLGRTSDIKIGSVFSGRLHFDIFPGKKLVIKNGRNQTILETSEITRIVETEAGEWIVNTQNSAYLVQQC